MLTTEQANHKLFIRIITFVRDTIAIYTIICTFYIAWKIAIDLDWPIIEFILFPWDVR